MKKDLFRPKSEKSETAPQSSEAEEFPLPEEEISTAEAATPPIAEVPEAPPSQDIPTEEKIETIEPTLTEIDEKQRQIRKILSADLQDFFYKLPYAKQKEFQGLGRKASEEIEKILIDTSRTEDQKYDAVFKEIETLLGYLRDHFSKANPYFFENAAVNKTDEIFEPREVSESG